MVGNTAGRDAELRARNEVRRNHKRLSLAGKELGTTGFNCLLIERNMKSTKQTNIVAKSWKKVVSQAVKK